jgi:hypothetical protein
MATRTRVHVEKYVLWHSRSTGTHDGRRGMRRSQDPGSDPRTTTSHTQHSAAATQSGGTARISGGGELLPLDAGAPNDDRLAIGRQTRGTIRQDAEKVPQTNIAPARRTGSESAEERTLAMRGLWKHQGQSGAIGGNQGQPGAISGHQGSSGAIRGHQRQSEAIRGHQWLLPARQPAAWPV